MQNVIVWVHTRRIKAYLQKLHASGIGSTLKSIAECIGLVIAIVVLLLLIYALLPVIVFEVALFLGAPFWLAFVLAFCMFAMIVLGTEDN